MFTSWLNMLVHDVHLCERHVHENTHSCSARGNIMSGAMSTDEEDRIEAEVRRRLIDRQHIQDEAESEKKKHEKHKKNPPFVQFAKSKMPNVRQHLRKNPVAVELFLFLAEHMDASNLVICSQQVLMEQ